MYFNLIKILTQNTVLFIKMNLIQFIIKKILKKSSKFLSFNGFQK